MTPTSSAFSGVISRPESAKACLAAATPKTTFLSVRRMALKSIQSLGSKSLTSPAAWQGVTSGSQRVMRLRPVLPATRLCQAVGMSLPTGLMMPRPVTATRRVKSGRRMAAGYSCLASAVGSSEPAVGGDVVDGDGACLASDAPDEAGQHLAGTDLDERVDAGRAHGLDGADPVDPPREMVDELPRDRPRRRRGARRPRWRAGERPDRGRAPRSRARRMPSAASAMSGRVGGHADRQQHGRAWRPGPLPASQGRLDRGALAADDDLARASCDWRASARPPPRRRRGGRRCAHPQPDDGRHGAVARGGLHEPAALADEAERRRRGPGRRPPPWRCTGPSNGRRGRPPVRGPRRLARMAAQSARWAATDAARSAGCAFTVRSSVSAGPSQASRESGSPSASSAARQTAAASLEATAQSATHAHRLRALAGVDVGRRQVRVPHAVVAGRRWRSVTRRGGDRRDGCTVAGPARPLAPRSCAIMHRMEDALLSPVVQAARDELQNPRMLSDRIAVGRAIWRELVIGFAQQLGVARPRLHAAGRALRRGRAG